MKKSLKIITIICLMIIYPGAKVDTKAYEPIAATLAEAVGRNNENDGTIYSSKVSEL